MRLRDDFVSLLEREGRTSVLDFGAGPGHDTIAFCDAGLTGVGIDLAHGNGALAGEAGATVIQASIARPPIRPQSFDAGWSMATLMHIPEAEVSDTLEGMISPLRPEAPLLIGLWGGPRRTIDDDGIEGQRRPYHYRPAPENRELLAAHGTVEHEEVWSVGLDDSEFQVFRLRIPH